jgi:hypothetical protein
MFFGIFMSSVVCRWLYFNSPTYKEAKRRWLRTAFETVGNIH